ncbi:MAG TPA: putative zinc-binding metallopeptidase [Solirubrobacteraceae bacterium]|nr:putative zinc-binding metallopeptidase [Solirubrobacteraceae bacterium]
MRAFTCGTCGQLLFFENNRCLRCNSRLGFVPSRLDIVVLDDGAQAHGAQAHGAQGHGANSTLRPCANAVLAQCTWVLEEGDPGPLCFSCRLTRTRPADDDPDGLAAFAKAEGAKRRLIFQLLDLGLPIGDDLAFDLLSSRTGPVVTGHNDGLITIDLGESDDARRERRRAELGEPYRTLLGHFRHEIGHYYWPILVERTDQLERARVLFADERIEYEAALQRHYEQGPPADWSERYVSSYATMHPWEDWAETFAHYLHIRDTLETAAAFGLVVAGPATAHDESLASAPITEAADRPFEAIIDDWLPLTYALNAINRSMGQEDLYPFTLAPMVIEKLAFVHDRVRAAAAPPRVPA